jgi:tRNA G10  N-methylase Trm11
MIPPKLAQMMLNIGLQGQTDKVLLDPFCGSGTVLMEAMLMGVRSVIGSDSSEKAVKNTRKNSEWAQERYNLTKKNLLEVNLFNVEKLGHSLKNESIDVIVTEPYLGPQKKAGNIERVKKELETLYTKAINEFRKILKKDGRVVMIWPVLRDARESSINPGISGFKIVKQLPEEMKVGVSRRDTIIYGRKGQRVWREIVVLEKI